MRTPPPMTSISSMSEGLREAERRAWLMGGVTLSRRSLVSSSNCFLVMEAYFFIFVLVEINF